MAIMWAHITTIVSAEPRVFVLNIALLTCEAVAAICVAVGIIWESHPEGSWRHGLSHRLVIWGVITEVFFSVMLFLSDEIVSGSQLIQIGALETRLAPRELSDLALQGTRRLPLEAFSGTKYIGVVAFGVPDGCSFWQQIDARLSAAKWVRVSPSPNLAAWCRSPTEVTSTAPLGVTVLVQKTASKRMRAAAVLVGILVQGGSPSIVDVTQANANGTTLNENDVLTVEIGPKP